MTLPAPNFTVTATPAGFLLQWPAVPSALQYRVCASTQGHSFGLAEIIKAPGNSYVYAAPIFHSGFGGTASVGSTPVELPITEWSVRPTARHATFQTSKNMGYDQVEANWKSATVTITVEYDFANNPFISPAGIQIGASLTNVILYLHQSASGAMDGPTWVFPSLLVTETNQSVQVNGGNIRVQITGVSNGSFTAPAV